MPLKLQFTFPVSMVNVDNAEYADVHKNVSKAFTCHVYVQPDMKPVNDTEVPVVNQVKRLPLPLNTY